MTDIKVTPLGAGQDVGRSCVLLSVGGKNIMLDCGMHMGYNDDRRFPDFSYITDEGSLNSYLDCVIITHFHLDHCGALPYMTEMVGYSGPIYMTGPTKAICPILLEDFRKITVDKKGETNFFTKQMIQDCMKKVTVVNLHQSIKVDDQLEIKAYYAGHVLGAAMFHVKVNQQSVVYTGDYNMTPDRHLGAAWIDKCRPDLLISESTYATTIRDSKRCRERDFLIKVHDCIEKGGKVLIPVFALGRAQELCILLETYWERMNLKVPIYFAMGLTEKATNYYKMFITWTNQKIKKTFVQRNMFDFKHILPFSRAYMDRPGAMVVFATPGMLHAGLSLQLFREWAPCENNMVIMPGYCVAGTVGHKILSGAKKVEFANKQVVDVKMAVEYMSFSAHADAKGIMQLITQCEPRNVLLVHGEASKMHFLAIKIKQELNLDCYMPANGETVSIPTKVSLPIEVSRKLLKATLHASLSANDLDIKKPRLLHGTLMITNNNENLPQFKLIETDQAIAELGVKRHHIRYTSHVRFDNFRKISSQKLSETIYQFLKSKISQSISLLNDGSIVINPGGVVLRVDVGSEEEKDVYIAWDDNDDAIGSNIVKHVHELQHTLSV